MHAAIIEEAARKHFVIVLLLGLEGSFSYEARSCKSNEKRMEWRELFIARL
jgi:hypothetical protein